MNKKILKYGFLLLIGTLASCMEKVDIEIPEDYDNALVTGLSIYCASQDSDPIKALTSVVVIDNENQAVTATLTTAEDLTQLKVTLTVSSGATVVNPLGSQIQDFSQARTVEIESPSKQLRNTWTITIVNP
jgi:hypothetical protein